MIDWIKNINKDFPSFWRTYLSKFDKKSNRFVVLSMNTTGLDTKNDFILSIGCISVLNNSILVSDSFEINLKSNTRNLENDFFSDKSEVIESEGIRLFVNYIENAVLIGHRINFDIEMINEALDKLKCGRLKNEALDVEVMYRKFKDINDKSFAIDDLLKKFEISKSDRDSTSEDAYSIALLFLKLKSRLGIS
jgi:DNA polymerase III subunit epsilon